jgi:hypothetical protein
MEDRGGRWVAAQPILFFALVAAPLVERVAFPITLVALGLAGMVVAVLWMVYG